MTTRLINKRVRFVNQPKRINVYRLDIVVEPTGNLLTEDGLNILTEDGQTIQLEGN